jgi:hypothetical protein
LLKNAAEKEQRITDLEWELKEVRETVAAEKKRLEDELAEEKLNAVEATVQFNTMSTSRSNPHIGNLVEGVSSGGMLTVMSCKVP